jgi:outer membrane protein assembly factor BamB
MVAEGNLYIIDLDGVTHIVKANRTGTVVGDPELGEGAFALPVFADGVVYIRGDGNLYCIGN